MATDASESAEDFYAAQGDDRAHCSVPIETEDGVQVICQEPVGSDNLEGTGEFPDDPRPPQEPAPGAAGRS